MDDNDKLTEAGIEFIDSFKRDALARSSNGKKPSADLPFINRHNARLRDLRDMSLKALHGLNTRQLELYQRDGALVRIKRIDGTPQIDVLNADGLVMVLDRAANFISDDGQRHKVCDPPDRLVRALLNLPEYDFPNLRGISRTPYFDIDGRLVTEKGYDRGSGVLLDPAGLDALDPVTEQPSAEHVRLAVEYLTGELLGDFAFAAAADRANAIGLLLTPFVRHMVKGPVPFHVIDSPQIGTGKSLLAAVIHIVAIGVNPPTGVEAFEPGEARKALTAILLEGRPIVLLDNISRTLISGAFAAALTADTWSDRVLGQSKMVTIENRTIWMVTGNNLGLSSELRRRAVEIRLDAKMERPEERTGFRHDDLKAWTREHRAALVHACLTLVQNWIALGRRQPSLRPLASFEAWSRVVGGVLQSAQIEGFLGNADSFRERADPEAKHWRKFIDEWSVTHSTSPVTADELLPIAEGLIPNVLGTGNEQSQRIRLGKAIGKREAQMFGEWRIETAECHDKDGRLRNGYRLARGAAQ